MGKKSCEESNNGWSVPSPIVFSIFKDNASSLTLESVRRLLEKDLELRKYALDDYKGLVKQYVEKMLDTMRDDEKSVAELGGEENEHSIKEETAEISTKIEVKNDRKKSVPGDEANAEDSPVMGVVNPKSEVGVEESPLSENRIEKAVWERADYLRSNSDNITMAGVRRLLEEDLGIQKSMLDPYKKFISQQIDKVLASPEVSKSEKDSKKKNPVNVSQKKNAGSSAKHGIKMDHKGGKMDKTPRSTTKNLESSKKRRVREESDHDLSSKKANKHVRRKGEESDNSDSSGCVSENEQPQSRVAKSVQSKEKTVAGHGTKVENLKSIIKSCGMSVPPTIYRKAKQAPETEREAFLVKELEAILSREGLSNNPAEKEIRDCRKRKQTARDLEGIDTSNIITSSRRRSTFSFAIPTQPAVQPIKGKVDSRNSKTNDKDSKDISDVSEEKDGVNKEEKNELQREIKEGDEVKEEEQEEEDGDNEEENEDDEEEEEEEEEEEDAEESDEFNEDESD